MSVWVTTDHRTLTKLTVKLGMQQDGFDQIVDGLQPGELAATEGSLFLNNVLINATK